MEKLDKLSDYEYVRLFDDSSETTTTISIATMVIGGIGLFVFFLLILMHVPGDPVQLTKAGWVLLIITIMCCVYWAYRLYVVLRAKRKLEELNARYEKDKNKVDMLLELRWDNEIYYNLYNYLNNAVRDRYRNGIIEKYWYIDEMFFGKLNSFVTLKKSIGCGSSALDSETAQKYIEIENILAKSAEKYYNSMINYQLNQNKTLVEVTLNVFKEVGI